MSRGDDEYENGETNWQVEVHFRWLRILLVVAMHKKRSGVVFK